MYRSFLLLSVLVALAFGDPVPHGFLGIVVKRVKETTTVGGVEYAAGSILRVGHGALTSSRIFITSVGNLLKPAPGVDVTFDVYFGEEISEDFSSAVAHYTAVARDYPTQLPAKVKPKLMDDIFGIGVLILDSPADASDYAVLPEVGEMDGLQPNDKHTSSMHILSHRPPPPSYQEVDTQLKVVSIQPHWFALQSGDFDTPWGSPIICSRTGKMVAIVSYVRNLQFEGGWAAFRLDGEEALTWLEGIAAELAV